MPAINHIEMSVSNLGRSAAFYGALFRELGWKELRPGMWIEDGCEVYLKETKAPGAPGAAFGPRHVAFRAPSREAVDRVAEAMRSMGATVIRGPQPMPEYSATYYTFDFRDPDGFVLEVCHD